MTPLFQQLKTVLEEEEYNFTFLPASKQMPKDQILILLGLDYKQRELKLEVLEHSQPPSPEFDLPKTHPLPARLQFRLILPFNVKDSALNDASFLLHFLNQSIDLPGFQLNELDGQVIYRYIWLTQSDHIDKLLLLNLLGVISFNLSLLSEIIESIAHGASTFNDLLAEVLKKFKP